jgi:hypothetical protein
VHAVCLQVSPYIIKAKHMVVEQAQLQGSTLAAQPPGLLARPPAGLAQVMFSAGPGQQQVLQAQMSAHAQHAGRAQMLQACAPLAHAQMSAHVQMSAHAQHAGQAQMLACAPLVGQQQQDVLQALTPAQVQCAGQAQVMYSSSPGQQHMLLQAPGAGQLQHAGQQAQHTQLLSSPGPGYQTHLQSQLSAQALQQQQQAGQAQMLACQQQVLQQQTGQGLTLGGAMVCQHMVTHQQANSIEQGSGPVWPQQADLSQQQPQMFILGPAAGSSVLNTQAGSAAGQLMLTSFGSPMYAAASAASSSGSLSAQLNMLSGSPAAGGRALLHNIMWQSSDALRQQQAGYTMLRAATQAQQPQLQEELLQQQAGYTMLRAATQAQQPQLQEELPQQQAGYTMLRAATRAQQQMGHLVFSGAAQEQQLLQQARHMAYSTGPQQDLPDQQQVVCSAGPQLLQQQSAHAGTAALCSAGAQLPQQQSVHAGTAAPACASVSANSAVSYQLAVGSLSLSNNSPPAQ